MPPPRKRPAPPRKPFLTPDASPFRTAVERRSALVLVFLSRLPKALPALLMLGLLALGLLLPGLGGAAFLVAAALFLAWVAYLAWPALPPPGRYVRLTVIGVVLAAAVFRAIS